VATVLPPRPKPSAVDTPAPVPPPVVVHRPARPLPAEVPALTEAVDEYVGAPREPAEPYRAPGWLRFAPSWLEQGGPGLDPLAGLGLPVSPPPAEAPQLITPPSFIPSNVEIEQPPAPPPLPLPPPVQEVATHQGVEQPPTVLKRRRANLGESRRLGLGTPISRPAGEPFTLPPQELVLPPTAPRQTPEPVAEPDAPSIVEDDEPVAVAEEPPPPLPPQSLEPPPPPAPVAPEPPSDRTEPPPRVVQPKYRATSSARPASAAKPVKRAVVVERVPPQLIDAVRTTQRADVSEVPIYRGPKVSEAARARGARAFAAGGAVFLPDEAGPTDSPAARGLLAHELVHAVQQRTLGPSLPALSSPEGQALEAEARVAERYYAGEAGAPVPPPLVHAPRPVVAAPAAEPEVSEVELPPPAPAQLAPLSPAPPQTSQATPAPASTLHTPFDEPTTQAVGQIAETKAKKVVEEWTNPALGGKGFTTGGKQAGPGRAGAMGTAAGLAATGVAFDPEARRQQLIDDELFRINHGRVGEVETTELTPDQLQIIDEQVAAEAEQRGVSVAGTASQTPEKPLTAGERWQRAFGIYEHDGNMGFAGAFTNKGVKPGDEGSWYASQDTDRSANDVMATVGLTGHEPNSFNYKDWLEGSGDQGQIPDVDAGHSGPSHTQADAERKAHGRTSQENQPFNLDQVDLDELSQRLYDRLRSKMRLELLVDRERSGRLTDFR
ncbi:MAG TPA: DUF4157 domain-containing protein, partial [Actinophytocola sp.]|uniref:eCIS core domain-containing protein n=1 Tax=Actinophytocola sp. TaxID=1872138 RepID=UPI002DDD0B56